MKIMHWFICFSVSILYHHGMICISFDTKYGILSSSLQTRSQTHVKETCAVIDHIYVKTIGFLMRCWVHHRFCFIRLDSCPFLNIVSNWLVNWNNKWRYRAIKALDIYWITLERLTISLFLGGNLLRKE